MKTHKAKLILVQLEELQHPLSGEENLSGTLVIVNEILKDAKDLAEEVLESEDKVS